MYSQREMSHLHTTQFRSGLDFVEGRSTLVRVLARKSCSKTSTVGFHPRQNARRNGFRATFGRLPLSNSN
jgi:hypothetical protein